MTRQEQLQFCKTCENRKFNPNYGLVCGLTDKIAEFEETCPDYKQDERIKNLENYRSKNTYTAKKKKQETISEPEKLTRDDLYLLTGMSLGITFLIRLLIYIIYSVENSITFYAMLIVLGGFAITLLLRRKENKRYKLFGDVKFKLVFSGLLTFFNMVYVSVLNFSVGVLLQMLFTFMILSFITSFLSIIIVAPVNFIIHKFTKSHAQVS